MILEFKVYKLKKSSNSYDDMKAYNINNEFIVVGEGIYQNEIGVYKAVNIETDGNLAFLSTFKLDETTYLFKKSDLLYIGKKITLDIPKERLTKQTIKEIKRLN